LSAPRLAPGTRRDIGLVTWVFSRLAGRAVGTTPPNVFTTLGRHRRLFRAWLFFAGRLLRRGTLPQRETELVILRVANLRDCAYELHQHRRLGARAGLSRAEIDRVAEGARAAGWTPRERVLLTAVEELHANGDLADSTWADLRGHLDDKGTIELLMLAGHYEMLATVLNTLRVPLDQDRRANP
jgi:AhpD family alkylhydroperoxidase